jgi:hypothetical protein
MIPVLQGLNPIQDVFLVPIPLPLADRAESAAPGRDILLLEL